MRIIIASLLLSLIALVLVRLQAWNSSPAVEGGKP
jgi:hypothetical protein